VSIGCTPDVEDIRLAGVEQYRNHQYIESMATLRHALDLSPSDAISNYYMGLNYRVLAARKFRDNDVPAAKKQLDRAIIYFTQAVKSWPNYMAAVAQKNECLELRGKYDAALSVAENVASNNRGIADHFIYLGDEYRQRADYDNALRAYKKALSTDPKAAQAYVGLGKLYQQVGDDQLAMDAYRKADELASGHSSGSDAVADQRDWGASEAYPAEPVPSP